MQRAATASSKMCVTRAEAESESACLVQQQVDLINHYIFTIPQWPKCRITFGKLKFDMRSIVRFRAHIPKATLSKGCKFAGNFLSRHSRSLSLSLLPGGSFRKLQFGHSGRMAGQEWTFCEWEKRSYELYGDACEICHHLFFLL